MGAFVNKWFMIFIIAAQFALMVWVSDNYFFIEKEYYCMMRSAYIETEGTVGFISLLPEEEICSP